MTELAVASTGLTKRFGAQTAVDGIDLAVPRGTVYGFLGPNGSGKTTTIRLLLGLLRPTAGSSSLLGQELPGVLTRVGALIEGPAFHGHLSGRANLHRLDAADALADPRTASRRVAEALERVGLAAAATKRYRAYSLGMKQRLAIAAALLQPRDLLVLDEPTNGLDPQGTREVRRLVASLADDGTTVLISSHLLAEIEQVCDHVGVMSRGRLLVQDSVDHLVRDATGRFRLVTPNPEAATSVLASLGAADVLCDGDCLTARSGELAPDEIVAALVHAGVRVTEFRLVHSSLEDVFVALTGEGFDVSG